jgi:hypothetical protein
MYKSEGQKDRINMYRLYTLFKVLRLTVAYWLFLKDTIHNVAYRCGSEYEITCWG